MAKYIESEAALNFVNGWREQLIPTYGKNDEYVKCLETVAEHLELLHAADVVPVRHGRWRKAKTFDIDRAYECSICGDTPFYDEIEKFNYCRRCGARMDGDGE